MDFSLLVFNRSRVYTCAAAKSGCVVYVPAVDHQHALFLKGKLEKFLAAQPEPPMPIAPPPRAAA